MDLRRLFKGDSEQPAATEADLGPNPVQEMQDEHRHLILELLEDGGVPIASVDVDVRHSGKARDGRHLFVGMLRLTHWQRKASLRLMIGLPLLEHALRRRLRGSWLKDVSQFGGLWLHPSGQMLDDATVREIRALLQGLEAGHVEVGETPPPPNESIWSLPPELGGPPPRTDS